MEPAEIGGKFWLRRRQKGPILNNKLDNTSKISSGCSDELGVANQTAKSTTSMFVFQVERGEDYEEMDGISGMFVSCSSGCGFSMFC